MEKADIIEIITETIEKIDMRNLIDKRDKEERILEIEEGHRRL